MNKLFQISQKRLQANRSSIWNDIQIDQEEIDKRFLRVAGNAECVCGKLVQDHPYSEAVLDIYHDLYLVELCDGTLGKL